MATQEDPLIPCPVIQYVFRQVTCIQDIISRHIDSVQECGICGEYSDKISSINTHMMVLLGIFPRQVLKTEVNDSDNASFGGENTELELDTQIEIEENVKKEEFNNLPETIVIENPSQEQTTEKIAVNFTKESSISKLFECSYCGKTYRRKKLLLDHCLQHLKTPKKVNRTECKRREYKCNICGKILYQRKGLAEHKRIHTGAKPYECNICGKTYRFSSEICRHRAKHSGKQMKAYKCDICSKSLSGKERLVEHKRMHTGEKPTQCDICGKKFYGRMALYCHRRLQHIKPNLKLEFKCEICGKTRARKSGLVEHMRTHTGVKPYNCEICGKGFTLRGHCNRHLETHKKEPKSPANKCKYCGRIMSGKERLAEHIRMHKGEKPAQCDTCGRTFHGRMALYSHRRTQHEIGRTRYERKRYKCDICGKSILDKSRLTEHLRIHTGEKPFFCTSCDKTFSRRSKLNLHVARMHRVDPVAS